MRMMRMFEGITKSKFYRKCKWDLKQIRTRIDLIMKKRNAVQKYLRNDIVDLLKNDLDINAYGRAEGLIVEMNRTFCYEFVDQCCEHILNHLQAIDKDRECPKECREAASSLMFAAARFADLPELRQLRTLFSERYGNSLDYYVSKQLSEKAKSSLPSKEEKLQLLEDIAEECGLEWSSKALGNNLYNASEKPKEMEKKDEGQFPRTAPPVRDIHADDSIPCQDAELVGEEEKPPLKYNLVPPPYTKSEEDTRGHGNGKAVKSVRTQTKRPSPREDTLDKINIEKAAQGQRILNFFDKDEKGDDERDDEEKMMDKLLSYYSRKGSEEKNAPGRALSLPAKPCSPIEDRKGHNRLSSLKSNLDQNANVHVHPRLPNYDDFVARLAALRQDGRR